MRVFLFLLMFVISLPTLPRAGFAGESKIGQVKAPSAQNVPAKNSPLGFNDHRLDELFTRLNRTRKFADAKNIAHDIFQQFRQSDSATIALLMRHADQAAENKNYPAALDFLDQIIVLDPHYTEGWNQRATIHYLLGNVKKSMSDISQVLVLEPRHIGALSELAQILDDSGDKVGALRVWERYLALFPADEEARKQATGLAENSVGQKV